MIERNSKIRPLTSSPSRSWGHETDRQRQVGLVGIRFYTIRCWGRLAPLLALTLTLALGVSGCGKGEKSPFKPVNGRVTYKEQPVSGAIISLVPKMAGGKSRSATAMTDDKGEFKMGTVTPGDGALPGEYDVTIRKTQSEENSNIPTSEMDEQKAAAKGRLPVAKIQELLPHKYGKAATSGFTVKVTEEGAKDLKFDLVD